MISFFKYTDNTEGNIAIGKYVYFDIVNQYLYYDKLKGDFILPTILPDCARQLEEKSNIKVMI